MRKLNPYRVGKWRRLMNEARHLRTAWVVPKDWRAKLATVLNSAAEARRGAWMPWDYTVELSVCQCCMLSEANGECCADDTHGGDGIEPWSSVDFDRDSVAMGGGHQAGCTTAADYDCDCACRDFDNGQCEGCGSWLAGERHLMTLFVNDRRNGTLVSAEDRQLGWG